MCVKQSYQHPSAWVCLGALWLPITLEKLQRMINSVFKGLKGVFTYLNDMLIASHNRIKPLHHLQALFTRVQENGLADRPEKCWFHLPELDVCRHWVEPTGICPLPMCVTAVENFPQPSTPPCKLLSLRYPTGTHLCHTSKKNQPIMWMPVDGEAFIKARRMITFAMLLAHPSPDTPLQVSLNASDDAWALC